jgi:hypothetical protein
LITTRSRIRTLAEEYGRSYSKRDSFYAVLSALDPEKATAADVAAAFQPRYGHDGSSWINTVCGCCGKDRGLVVQLGQEPDYESSTVFACVPCLKAALAAARSTTPSSGPETK